MVAAVLLAASTPLTSLRNFLVAGDTQSDVAVDDSKDIGGMLHIMCWDTGSGA